MVKYRDIPRSFHLVAFGHVHRFQFLSSHSSRIHSDHSMQKVTQNVNGDGWYFNSQANSRQIKLSNPVICYSGSSEKVSLMERNENKGFVIGTLLRSNKNGSNMIRSQLDFIQTSSVPMLYLTWDLVNKSIDEHVDSTYKRIKELVSSSKSKSLVGIIRISLKQVQSLQNRQVSQLKEYAIRENILLEFSIKQ